MGWINEKGTMALILILDPDEQRLEMSKQILEFQGHRTLTAETMDAALFLCQQYPVNVVMTDLVDPMQDHPLLEALADIDPMLQLLPLGHSIGSHHTAAKVIGSNSMSYRNFFRGISFPNEAQLLQAALSSH